MHGLGSSTTFYETALSLSTLALTYRLVRYDFEGHGLSPLSDKADLTIDSLAEDLRDVMDAVGVEKAAGVVGHSMSGLVAMTFAARWPERVEKLCTSLPVS
jgi:pimeloyl-ACP methyl ester carboxylesterase